MEDTERAITGGTHLRPFRRRSPPSYKMPPCEAPMPFSMRPYRRSPVQCAA